MVLTERALDRESMVEHQLRRRGIRDEGLLEAFRTVPREEFVGDAVGEFAYEDTPLPIDEGQTITQPYILAVMVQALDLRPTDRVLEVGASYSYARADSADLGPDPIERFPRHRADGWGRVTPTAMLAALVRARYAGRAMDLGMTTPAYVVWDASLTANLRGDWRLTIKATALRDGRWPVVSQCEVPVRFTGGASPDDHGADCAGHSRLAR